MFLKKLALNPKILSENYNGAMSLGNFKFYDQNGGEIIPQNIKTLDDIGQSASFTLNGIKGIVTANTPYSAAYGVYYLFSKNWTMSTAYLCGKDMNLIENPRERGVFFEFEKSINLSGISFNYGTTKVLNHAEDWEVWTNDCFCVQKDIYKKQDDGQDIHTVRLKLSIMEKKVSPGSIYYIQGIDTNISSFEFRPLSIGGEYGGSYSVTRFEMYNDVEQYTLTLQKEVSGYECYYTVSNGSTLHVKSKYNYDTSTYAVKQMFGTATYPCLYVSNLNGKPKDDYGVWIDFSVPIKITKIIWKDWDGYPGRNGKNWEVIINKGLSTEKIISNINSVSGKYEVNFGD